MINHRIFSIFNSNVFIINNNNNNNNHCCNNLIKAIAITKIYLIINYTSLVKKAIVMMMIDFPVVKTKKINLKIVSQQLTITSQNL